MSFVCEICGEPITNSNDLGCAGVICFHKSCLAEALKPKEPPVDNPINRYAEAVWSYLEENNEIRAFYTFMVEQKLLYQIYPELPESVYDTIMKLAGQQSDVVCYLAYKLDDPSYVLSAMLRLLVACGVDKEPQMLEKLKNLLKGTLYESTP